MNGKTAEGIARVIDKAHDQAQQARSQAIDDCIKVVLARIKTWEGAVLDGENRMHGAAVAEGKLTELEALIPRLEALKGST